MRRASPRLPSVLLVACSAGIPSGAGPRGPRRPRATRASPPTRLPGRVQAPGEAGLEHLRSQLPLSSPLGGLLRAGRLPWLSQPSGQQTAARAPVPSSPRPSGARTHGAPATLPAALSGTARAGPGRTAPAQSRVPTEPQPKPPQQSQRAGKHTHCGRLPCETAAWFKSTCKAMWFLLDL